jgi:ribosome-associated protein
VNSTVTSADILHELDFITSRSGGPGGQHVNKVSSKVTLKWNVAGSGSLPAEQKDLLLQRWANRLTAGGVLVLHARESRSQLRNKETVIHKLDALLRTALTPRKTRKPTKPTKASIQKRKAHKRHRSETKKMRRKP